jgi:Fe-S-cluster containining protein
MPWLGQSININAAEDESSSPWFAENNLPFDCTGCGNCCKTRGDVYMSPTETKDAATLLGLSISEFKEQFVEEEEVTVAMSLDPEQIPEGETGWTVLRHKQEDGSCIFLSDEGMCNIYEARPVQCSTYPFWPRIMANRDAWNSEVRLVGESDTQEGTISDTNEPVCWSMEKGGCEGMHKITADGTSKTEIVGISSADAEGRLAEYERYKRRFPTSEMRPIT